MTTGFLSYEEELLISDDLYHRRVAKETASAEQRPLTRKESKAVKKGDASAKRLVEAYIPHARRVAWGIWNQRASSSSGVEFEDLFQAACVAMMQLTNAFDARGKARHEPSSGHPGMRFASYSAMHVRREVIRCYDKGRTPMTVGVSSITKTSVWMSNKKTLKELLGREPSSKEIEAETKISASEVLEDLPMYQHTQEISASHSVQDDLAESASESASSDYFDAALMDALRERVSDGALTAFVLFSGIDRGFPRDMSEVAKEMRTNRSKASLLVGAALSEIKHPSNRRMLSERFRSALR